MLENDHKQAKEERDKEKRVIGLYGEMSLAMALHEKGWQVYKAYIDEHVDFIIARYYCTNCQEFSQLQKRPSGSISKISGLFPTDRCHKCHQKTIKFIVRFLQIKTSRGILKTIRNAKSYSFHAKLRSNVDDRSFYVWIALIGEKKETVAHYYVFHHKEISKFDDLNLDSYQKTDNQKTTLHIDRSGKVLNKGRKHGYSCFNDDFYDNFDKLDKLLDEDR